MSKNRPIHQIRLGRLKATIWANETDYGVKHNVQLTRIYKAGNQWKSTDSFGRDDLLAAAEAARLAFAWIIDHETRQADKPASTDLEALI